MIEKMDKEQRYQLLIAIPWGNGERGIKPNFLDYPNYNDMPPEQIRKVYAPHYFNLDAKRGLHVLSNVKCSCLKGDENYIFHFNPSGNFDGKTPIPKDLNSFKFRRIVDFSVDTALNCFLLEHLEIDNSSHHRLIKIDREGKVIWNVNGPFLKGDFHKLLMGKDSNLYLTFASPKNIIAQINPESGEIRELAAVQNAGNNAFINEEGNILNIVYFEKERRRGLSVFTPSSKEVRFTVGSSELFGLFLFPFGTDNQLSCYTYKIPNVYDKPAVVKISFDGHIVYQQNFKDLLVRSGDNAIFTGYNDNSEFVISGYFQDGTTQRWIIPLPGIYSSIKTSNQKLVKVDHSNKFYILVGEQPGDIGILLVYSENGELCEEIRHPENLLAIESTLQTYSYWKVDGDGNIYLPITDPEGFKIVRMDSI